MHRSIVPVVLAMALTGCFVEPPPPPMAEFYVPPPRPLHPAPHPAKHIVVAATPASRPQQKSEAEQTKQNRSATLKFRPLGPGKLTALAVGHYMDDQEKGLRAALHGGAIVIGRVGDSLVLDIRDDVLFAANSDALSDKGQAILRIVAGSARKFDSTLLFVNGFTDTATLRGNAVKQSQKLADAVARNLAANDVDRHRISAKGYGTENLKVPTGPNVKEPRNRRIEIDIAPRLKG